MTWLVIETANDLATHSDDRNHYSKMSQPK